MGLAKKPQLCVFSNLFMPLNAVSLQIFYEINFPFKFKTNDMNAKHCVVDTYNETYAIP